MAKVLDECGLCGSEIAKEERGLCSKCLDKLRSASCPLCGGPLSDLELVDGLFKHRCGARFHPALLQRALDEGFEEILRQVCDEYGCDGDLEECLATCARVREFVELGTSKIKPILEPVLRDKGMYVEYGWKACLIRDGEGLLAVLIDQHNPSYLLEGPSTVIAEGPDKATIIGADPTERQVALLGDVEEALKRHGYVDVMKVFVEPSVEMGTVEAP